MHWVHPRIRGEYILSCQLTKDVRGSPPHTRGIPVVPYMAPNSPRFTPAYAGNTPFDNSGFYKDEVHPRIRGEYWLTGG